MSATSTVDDRNFRASIRELSQISGRTYEDTFKLAGAGPIIKILAKDPKAKPAAFKAIRQAVEKAASIGYATGDGRVTINVRIAAGRTWYRFESSGKWRMVYGAGPSRGWHLSDREWTRFKSVVADRKRWIVEETRRRAARRGLLRMSFIQIADSMGINLSQVSGGGMSETIPRRAAMPGKLGQGRSTASGAEFKMIFANFSGGVRGAKTGAYWRGRLQAAINRRSKAIETDMRKGVMQDMRTRAKRYPGLFVEG